MSILLTLVALLVAVIGAGWLIETLASARDTSRMRGRLIKVGRTCLHAVVQGRRTPGEPAILLDGGLSANSLAWPLVEEALKERYQTISFDRAGHLWSDAGVLPRDAAQNRAELRALLGALDITPPFIYVAHSYSGFLARLFAHEHPDEVAGLVLPETSTSEVAALLMPTPAEMREMRRDALFSRFGLSRLTGLFKRPEDLPPEPLGQIVADWMRLTASAKSQKAVCDELETFIDNGAQADRVEDFGDLPLVVIASSRAFSDFPVPDGMSREEADAINVSTQEALSKLSSNSVFWLSEDTGHEVPWDQPEIIVRGIDWVVEQWRSAQER